MWSVWQTPQAGMRFSDDTESSDCIPEERWVVYSQKVMLSLQLTNMVMVFTSTWIWNNENTITQYTKWFCCHTPFHQTITYSLYYTVYYLFIFPSISCLFSETFLCDWTDGFCIALCRMRDCGLWWSLTSASYHFHCGWVCRLLYLFSDMVLATEHGMQMIPILVLLELDRDIRLKGKRRQWWWIKQMTSLKSFLNNII